MNGRILDLGTLSASGLPTRPVRAYVPARLDPTRPHATLYLFDGQNVFSDEGSYATGWHAHAAAERLGSGFHPPVVIAIGNGGAHRVEELGPRAGDFVSAIVRTLIPRVEATFHGRGRRILGGSSLGGLGALQGWIEHPDTFHGALAMSPSLWFARRRLLRGIVDGAHPIPADGRLYLDAGARERGRMFADANALAELLATRGLGPDRLLWRPDAKGAHRERDWRRRLPKALRFLFRRG